MSLNDVPFGGLPLALCTALALVPLRRPPLGAKLSWLLAMAPSEVPGFFVLLLFAFEIVPAATGGASTTREQLALGLAVITAVGLLVLAGRAIRTRSRMDRVLDHELPVGWREAASPIAPGSRLQRPRWWQIVVPWPLRPRSVERLPDVVYGPETHQRLDIYRHWTRPHRSPTLIHLHGGRFRWGGKSREARSLLHRLAEHGWTCISADYRIAHTPGQAFPDALIDAKRVIAWAREEGAHHGIDPEAILMAGSSAGAHLTVMAALTANEPAFQPGFEGRDTSLVGGIGLYGYYGRLGGPSDTSSSPHDHLSPEAAPLLLVHGGNDTYTPVEGARELADAVSARSRAPAIFVELPAAQHSFDVFPSIRFERVVDGIEAFANWACIASSEQRGAPPARR